MKLTFDRVITIALLSVGLSFTLPLSNSASTWKVVWFKMIRYLGFLNHFILALTLLRTSFKCTDELSVFIPSMCLTCICFCGNMQTIICEVHEKRLQHIITALRQFAKVKESSSKEILQSYIDKYAVFYGVYTFWVYFTATHFVFAPLISSQPLPTRAEYSISMEYSSIRYLLYIHQAIAAYQSAALLCLNSFCALLYFFIAMRFDILSNDLRMAQNMSDVKNCVDEHRRLLALTKEVILATRFLIAADLIFGTARIVFSALTFVRPQPMLERAQYLGVTFTTFFSSFVSMWPADSLLYLNNKIATSCYSTKWCDHDKGMRTNLLIIMISCQRNLSLSVGCILPAASLTYYRAYLSKTVSYFTMLHVVFEGKAE